MSGKLFVLFVLAIGIAIVCIGKQWALCQAAPLDFSFPCAYAFEFDISGNEKVRRKWKKMTKWKQIKVPSQ